MSTGIHTASAIPELTSTQLKNIHQALDTQLNSTILCSLWHGFYTGVLVTTLWTIAQSKNRLHGRGSRFLLIIILLLYMFTTFGILCTWILLTRSFIINGQSFWTRYKTLFNPSPAIHFIGGLAACFCTILADTSLARPLSFYLALLDCVGAVLACCARSNDLHYSGSRVFVLYYDFASQSDGEYGSASILYTLKSVNWAVLYSSLVLATLLWCTILIVYRILIVSGIATGIRVYRRVIEIMVDSASLYSAVIIVLLVFEVHNEVVGNYLTSISVGMRGIVPTILVGRVAAGHTRPDDSGGDSRSTVSSLEFGNHSISQDSSTRMDAEDDLSLRATLDLEEGLEEGSQCRNYGRAENA
ncbi:uncharacterized protein EV420DRAFT_1647263 [Desarmillaria tabescens]|uniref:Uncharacterized protein n=1 Tax=Armillaria tabescens TaxID=1929756 RepID=A0AA39MX21_ARMTA|nr:uncharacterized protein EV420DRAFT_1647263 [Desarmillaria tabescens]KAK0448985.1 hypothetical protein EV420DRAFT_1647263 [Desarmillaria tabescens]